MSEEGIPPSVKRAQQEKAVLEIEAATGYRHIFDEHGKPKVRTIVFIVGFTIVLVLFAIFLNWLWWIPADIFIFGLVGMSFFYLMMRRERAREERKGV